MVLDFFFHFHVMIYKSKGFVIYDMILFILSNECVDHSIYELKIEIVSWILQKISDA